MMGERPSPATPAKAGIQHCPRPLRLSLGSVVKLHVIPAKAGIQGVFVSKSFCGIERFWIPAFAGMTEIKLSHVSESNLTTLPR